MSRLGQALVKVAASAAQMLISQRRAGVRPISVARYLQREGEGTLRKGMDALHSLHEHHGLRKRAAADILPGGIADHIPDSAFPKKDLEKGTRIEMEHTTNKALAREIATDHLAEHPEYYDALVPMEHMLEKIEKKAGSMTSIARSPGQGAGALNSYAGVDDPKWGKPATAKVKPGDAPSMDEVPDYKGTTEGRIPMRQLDTAGIKLGTGVVVPVKLRREIEAVLKKEDELKRTPPPPPAELGPLARKVASVMGRLTHKEPPLRDQTVYQMGKQLNRDKMPTREQEDYAEWPIREREGFRQAGSDTPTDQYNPDWNKR